jgi:hypothetical protein
MHEALDSIPSTAKNKSKKALSLALLKMIYDPLILTMTGRAGLSPASCNV